MKTIYCRGMYAQCYALQQNDSCYSVYRKLPISEYLHYYRDDPNVVHDDDQNTNWLFLFASQDLSEAQNYLIDIVGKNNFKTGVPGERIIGRMYVGTVFAPNR